MYHVFIKAVEGQFELELIEEAVANFDTMEEAYDHLTEFHQLKAFEVIGDLEEEQEQSSSDDEWQEIKGQKISKTDQLLKFQFRMENVINAKASGTQVNGP